MALAMGMLSPNLTRRSNLSFWSESVQFTTTAAFDLTMFRYEKVVSALNQQLEELRGEIVSCLVSARRECN